jgi:cephalosporin hydroxylase
MNQALDRWAARRTMRLVLARTDSLRHVRWLDHSVWQFPIDAWILQEVVSSLRPELIVETGTYPGRLRLLLRHATRSLGRAR